jgi:SHS2 domain-containing protein
MPYYRLLEHTADVAIEVRGADLAELLKNLAYAMVDLMAAADAVRAREERPISLAADSDEDLLVAWANEIVYRADSEGLLLPFAEGVRAGGHRAEGLLRGERLDPARHQWRGELKAATHHDLALRRDATGGLVATLVIDV